jgi:hypothetical protein
MLALPDQKSQRNSLRFFLDKADYPQSLHSIDFRFFDAYDNFFMTQPSPSGKIIFLGACLIAAVRLAREEKWDNSPRVVARIADSIQLAERIFERMRNDRRHFNE